MTGELPLDLGDRGRREERTEWGLRYTRDGLHKRGHVDLRPSESNARECVGNQYIGCAHTEVVSRTVATYTTEWEAS